MKEPICQATAEGRQLFGELFTKFEDSHNERYVKQQIRGTGMEYVGEGDSRIVLLDRSGQYLQVDNACVVKIHKYGDVWQNENEVKNWENAPDEVRRHLLRPTDWADDYSWMVMPYVDTEVTHRQMYELEVALLESGIKGSDISKRNAARLQDRAVLIDYGFGFRPIDFDEMSLEERVHLKKWRWDIDD